MIVHAAPRAKAMVQTPKYICSRSMLNVRFWHLADIGLVHCTCPLLGVKRTCRFALQMSAFDPKRTSAGTQSITSSAATINAGGKATPIAFADLALINNGNFVGSWTGRSPAFSPLMIRRTYTPTRRNMST